MAARRERILFVYDRHLAPFIRRDWEIVSGAYPDSELFRFGGFASAWRLRRAVARNDLILCWFGGAHALTAAIWNLQRRPLVVVAGGWDVVCLPQINYGLYCRAWRAAASRWLFARADRVFAVSHFTARRVRENARVECERIRVIGHGFDAAAWPFSEDPRARRALTLTAMHPLVKGLDLVVAAARLLPDVQFDVVGLLGAHDREQLAGRAPANVRFTGWLSKRELQKRMAESSVYLQPSRHESFGCAVAEAMLTGCIPVVSRAGALPELVADAGFYVEPLTPEAIAASLDQALRAPGSMRLAARQRVAGTYGIETYAARFLAELALLLGPGRPAP